MIMFIMNLFIMAMKHKKKLAVEMATLDTCQVKCQNRNSKTKKNYCCMAICSYLMFGCNDLQCAVFAPKLVCVCIFIVAD